MSHKEDNRPQRPVTLLPAIPGVTPSPHVPADHEPQPLFKPKRQVVLAACEPCRRRKSKCSAERPQCVTCLDRGTECEYVTNSVETRHQALKRKYDGLIVEKSALEQLFNLIRTRSESEAEEIYRRVRGGGDPDAIVKDVTSGEMLLQFSVAQYTVKHANDSVSSKAQGSSRSSLPSMALDDIQQKTKTLQGETQGVSMVSMGM